MKYYYPVELPCYTKIQEFAIEDIKKKLHNTFFSEQVRIKHNISGNLLNTINNDLYNLGLPKLSYAQSYIRRKNTKQGIHVDGDSELISLAINIPLSGTIGSKFNWYDGEYELIKTNVIKTEKAKAPEMERFIKAYIQSFNERMIGNKLTVQ